MRPFETARCVDQLVGLFPTALALQAGPSEDTTGPRRPGCTASGTRRPETADA